MNTTIQTLKEIAQIDILRASQHKTDYTLYEVFLTAPMAFKEVLEGIGWVYMGSNEYKNIAPPVSIDFRRGSRLTNPSKRIFLNEVVRAILNTNDIYITDDVFQGFSEEIEGLPVSLMKNIVKGFIVNDIDINEVEEEIQTTDIYTVEDIDINDNSDIDIIVVEENFGEQVTQENLIMNTIDINDINSSTEQNLMENQVVQEKSNMKELSFGAKTHSELKKAEIEGKFKKEGVTFKVEGRVVVAYKTMPESEYDEWTYEIEDYILSRMEEIYLEKCHAYAEEHERKWAIEEAERIAKLKADGLIDEDGNDIEEVEEDNNTDIDINDNDDIDITTIEQKLMENQAVTQENSTMSTKTTFSRKYTLENNEWNYKEDTLKAARDIFESRAKDHHYFYPFELELKIEEDLTKATITGTEVYYEYNLQGFEGVEMGEERVIQQLIHDFFHKFSPLAQNEKEYNRIFREYSAKQPKVKLDLSDEIKIKIEHRKVAEFSNSQVESMSFEDVKFTKEDTTIIGSFSKEGMGRREVQAKNQKVNRLIIEAINTMKPEPEEEITTEEEEISSLEISTEEDTITEEESKVSNKETITKEEEEVLGVHRMQENSENNVNDNHDSVNDSDNGVLKLSELKGLPLFNYSKKPYIEWSKYDNGEDRKVWPTKNGSIEISKKTGEFFKTGENAWNGKNVVVIDIDSTYEDSSLQYDITNKFLTIEGYDRDVSGEERKEALRKYATATAVSGSGGLHMYFTYPEGIELKNTQSKIIKGVDTRASGGIILLPGTEAKSDKYAGVREYKLVSEEILPIPEKLLEELVKIQKPSYVPPITSGELISIEDSSLDNYRKAAVRNTILRLEETTANRNEMLTECARTLGMLLIEESIAYDLLAEASGKIGLPHSEFVATFNSAYHWGIQHPKKIEKKDFESKSLSSLERKIMKIEENRNIDDIDILNTSEKSNIDINTIEDKEENQSSQENTYGVQGEHRMQENKVSIPAPENIEIIEEVKKVEKEVRDTNDNNSNSDSGIVAISDEEKKQLTFEIESHARNLWEYEIDKVDVLRVSDVNRFVYYDDKDFVWKETETPGHKLREYRRNKINDFKRMGYKYQLDISRTIRSMETESFITAGKNTIIDSKGVKNEVFNNSKTEILIKNGVLNAVTGEVRPATSKDLFTKKINTEYNRTFEELINDNDYSEAYEKFEKVFKNFGSQEVREYMQGILGNSLFAMPNRTSVSFWWYSKGSSGKSAIINALENTLGEFSSRPAGDVFLASGDSFEFVTMEGSRVAFVEEAPSGWLHAGKLKKVVGTEKASMRNLHEKSRKVTVTWTAHVSINTLPKVRPSDFDFGTLRRIMILPFFTKYEKQEADVTLMNIADNEKVREIILAWLVEGAKKWYADIDFEKCVPLEIIKATEDFYSTVEADVDPMSDFVQSIVPSENHYINSDDLFEGWMEYCKRNNIVHKENSLRTIQRLEEKIGEKLTPKTRAKGMLNSSYVLLYPEYVNSKTDDSNTQKKRLLGYKYSK